MTNALVRKVPYRLCLHFVALNCKLQDSSGSSTIQGGRITRVREQEKELQQLVLEADKLQLTEARSERLAVSNSS